MGGKSSSSTPPPYKSDVVGDKRKMLPDEKKASDARQKYIAAANEATSMVPTLGEDKETSLLGGM